MPNVSTSSSSTSNLPPPPKRGAMVARYQPKRDLARCTSRYPKWAVDPLTMRLMTCPVTIRAPCEHTVDKTSFMAWINQGNAVCPVCFTPLTQIAAIPNKDLAARIEKLTTNTNSDDDDETEKKVPESLNSSLKLDSVLDYYNTPSDPLARLSQSEDLSVATARWNNLTAKSSRNDPQLAPPAEENEEQGSTNSPPTTPTPSRPKPKVPTGLFSKLTLSPTTNSPKVIKTTDMVKAKSSSSPRRKHNSPPTTPTTNNGGKPSLYETLKRNLTGSPGKKQPQTIPVLNTIVG